MKKSFQCHLFNFSLSEYALQVSCKRAYGSLDPCTLHSNKQEMAQVIVFCLSVCLSVCLSDCLSVGLSVCLSVCLSVSIPCLVN